jgi:hypothetical protein
MPRFPQQEKETERLIKNQNFFSLYRGLFTEQRGQFSVGEVYPVIILNDFFFKVSYGLNLCIGNLSTRYKKNADLEKAYSKALFLCRIFIASFPMAAAHHIKTYDIANNLKHRLTYDQIPENIASLPECNPFNGLWYAAFIGKTESDPADDRYTTLYTLAATFREMGWGREIVLDIDSLFKHISASSPAIATAIENTHSTKVTEILSGFLRGLMDGYAIEYPKMVPAIHTILNTPEITPLLPPLNDIITAYLFFPPPKNRPAAQELSVAENKNLSCILQ